jgi:AraC-like DNA-binding protein
MPGSLTSVFGEPDDFQAALKGDGVSGLLITGDGEFRARLTRIVLDCLSLTAAEEEAPRIAFITVPADMVLVTLPVGGRPFPVWGGIEMQAGELVTLGPGERFHARSDGPCAWDAIYAPAKDLVEYGRAVDGVDFVIPPAARWRPRSAAMRALRHFFRAAIRMAETRSGAPTSIRAAHGLEQQLIDALLECVSAGPAGEETPSARRHRGISARFEDLLQAEPFPRMTEIRTALGVSEWTLRECAKKHLGMGPSRYRRMHGIQEAHRALRRGNPDVLSVSEVARRYGFCDFGRFDTTYRAVYGELPSVTLRRDSLRAMPELALGRPRAKEPKSRLT